MRPVVEKMRPPRALYCAFPLGRPLGKPLDESFQRDVLVRALALTERSDGPVLEDYPEIVEATDQPIACTLPPRFDASDSPAVDEARGLRRAYDRASSARGITAVGRVVDADGVPDALQSLSDIAAGAPWDSMGSDHHVLLARCHDIRTYYEEAALELVTAVPEARALEAWFFDETEAGKVFIAARDAVREQGAPRAVWSLMVPAPR